MVVQRRSEEVVRVPDVVKHPLEKARLVIEAAGLRVDEVLYTESYDEQNTVLEQKPLRGQMVYEGSAVTLHVARRSYMELLPAIFRRSDAVGRNVVRDICFLFEHMFSSVEDTLDRGDSFYNPAECPPEFLHWLAGWTAMVLDYDWPEVKKRAILRRAVDLYRIRGTRRGLSLFLYLFIGKEPRIDENEWPFKGFRVGVEARVGVDSVVLPPIDLAHCFTITVPMKFTDITPEMVIRVHEIIQREKPAHTHYYLRFAEDDDGAALREFYTIGVSSGIGVGGGIGMGIGVPPTEVEGAVTEVAAPTEAKAKPKAKPKAKGKPADMIAPPKKAAKKTTPKTKKSTRSTRKKKPDSDGEG